jgi:hypothetical protein
VDKLDETAEKELEQRVHNIYMRYGNNRDQVWANASDYEKEILLKYYTPRATERFRELFPCFAPIVFSVFFEHDVYQKFYYCWLDGVFRSDVDAATMEYYLDRMYEGSAHRELLLQFWSEVDVDKERPGVSKETRSRMNVMQEELNALKNRAFIAAQAKYQADLAYEAETMRLEALEQAKQEPTNRTRP